MGIEFKHGAAEVKALAAQAGKAQAANVALNQRFTKDMAMMDYQFKLAGEQRARAWDLEKMEIASRNDFQQEETARVQKQQQWSLIKKQIEDSDILSEPQKEQALHENFMKLHGGVVPRQKSVEEQMMEAAFNGPQGGGKTGGPTQGSQDTAQSSPDPGRSLGVVETPEGMQVMSPDGGMKPINQSGMVNVINPSGERVKIKGSQLQEAIAEGYQFIGVAASSMGQTTKSPTTTAPRQKDSSFDFEEDVLAGIFGADTTIKSRDVTTEDISRMGWNPRSKTIKPKNKKSSALRKLLPWSK